MQKSEIQRLWLLWVDVLKRLYPKCKELLRALLKGYATVYGGTLKEQILFVANPYGEKGHLGGGASGRSVSVHVGGELDRSEQTFLCCRL